MSEILGNSFKILLNYVWDHAVCYEALRMGGWGWKNMIFSVTIFSRQLFLQNFTS